MAYPYWFSASWAAAGRILVLEPRRLAARAAARRMATLHGSPLGQFIVGHLASLDHLERKVDALRRVFAIELGTFGDPGFELLDRFF